MAKLNPYLNFSGQTEEAFNFYKSVFGGEFQSVMRFKDAPEGMPAPPDYEEKIMHISLPISGDSVLNGSDRPDSFGPMTRGDNFRITITPDGEAEAKKLFNGLSAGGKVTMPLEKAFWGAWFGMFTDKYGINWMVNYQAESQL